MRKILFFVFSAMLLVCSCKKTSSSTTNLLDLHDVEIYPGESVTITASAPCDWYKDGHLAKLNSTSYTFISEDKVTEVNEYVLIYAHPHMTDTTVDDFESNHCNICIKASYILKYLAKSAQYRAWLEDWFTNNDYIYVYHDIPDQYYLIKYSIEIYAAKAYKITENPNYRSSGTTPDLSYRYMCTVNDETIYLKF